jgi:quercetin dioxygenase-like cupin family protein
MEIKRRGSQPSAKGPAEWFTGTVRIDPLFDAPVPARAAGASVTFEPGARTAWHTHPLGQTLIVTSGVGRAQRWGGPVEEIRPGDVVWFPPGEKHWHGAAPTTAMTHIAIQEKLDGKPVDWLEHVTAEQYEGRSDASSCVCSCDITSVAPLHLTALLAIAPVVLCAFGWTVPPTDAAHVREAL